MTEFVQYRIDYAAQRAYEVKARQMRAEAVASAVKSVAAFLRAQFLRADAPRASGTARA